MLKRSSRIQSNNCSQLLFVVIVDLVVINGSLHRLSKWPTLVIACSWQANITIGEVLVSSRPNSFRPQPKMLLGELC